MKTQVLATALALAFLAHSSNAEALSLQSFIRKLPAGCQGLSNPSAESYKACETAVLAANPKTKHAILTACNLACTNNFFVNTCSDDTVKQVCGTVCCAAAGGDDSKANVSHCLSNDPATSCKDYA